MTSNWKELGRWTSKGFHTLGQLSPPVGYFREIQAGPFYDCVLDFAGGETCWGEYARQALVTATAPAVSVPHGWGVVGAIALLGAALVHRRKKLA